MKRRSFIRLAAVASLTGKAYSKEASPLGVPTASLAKPAPLLVKAKIRTDDRYWKYYEVKPLVRYPQLLDPAITPPTQLSKFGGDISRHFEATGFFRLEKTPNRWWFVDPEGFAFLSVGLNGVGPGGNDLTKAAYQKHFADGADSWAESEIPKIKSWGFNTAGCWSNEATLRDRGMVYTATRWPGWDRGAGPMETFMKRKAGKDGIRKVFGGIWPVFSSEFSTFVQSESKRLTAEKDDPWLLGRFLDNEPVSPDLRSCLDYPGADPCHIAARKAARDWISTRGIDPTKITEQNQRDWEGFVFEKYLSIVVSAIRLNDPNHLVFGPRLHGQVLKNRSVIEAVGRWCDVACANPYGQWFGSPDMLHEWTKVTGKPILISEFYAKAQDSGLKNHGGAGFILETQNDRGLFYQNFILNTVVHPSVIGWHWHRYLDDQNEEKSVNKGLVRLDFRPYEEAIEPMNQMNLMIYAAAGSFSKGA